MTISSSRFKCPILFRLITCSMFLFCCPAGWCQSARNLLPGNGITEVKTLEQNWSEKEARWFYNIPQGSRFIPYNWFLHLEQASTEKPFLDSEYIRSLGYLPRTPDNLGNPDGLPIGFAKDGAYLGMTCATCHTNQINFQGKAWLVDGAPTLGDAEKLQRGIVDSLAATLNDNMKFQRFSDRVLGSAAGVADRERLRKELKAVLDERRGYNERNLPRTGNAFGPGRVDAFGAILNEVASTFGQVPGNHAPADAPVSYPFLWDTPHHDKVQWNGAAENERVAFLKPIVGTVHVGALGRNVGEVLGVFGKVDATEEGGLRQLGGYVSSANKTNLIDIEETLRKLWSPRWPQEMGGINENLRAPGQSLFIQHCQGCHARIDRIDPDRTVVARMSANKTDERMARNFIERVSKSGMFEGRRFKLPGLRKLRQTEPTRDLLIHAVQRVVLRPDREDPLIVPQVIFAQLRWSPNYVVQAEIEVGNQRISGVFEDLELVGGKVKSLATRQALSLIERGILFQEDRSTFDRIKNFVSVDGAVVQMSVENVGVESSGGGTRLVFAQPAVINPQYKARPLNGIWATAPYLHNGSVPNLDELLKPAAKRVKRFKMGSREFDPEKVGFRTDLGDFEFDTALLGNSSAGHEYGREFSELERKQLVEYMKSL